jgi:hypothetical protein
MNKIGGCPIFRPLLARCGNSQISPWKSSGITCTFARAFVSSHIWPKPGQIWGTLIGGKETFPTLVHPSLNLPQGKSFARDDKSVEDREFSRPWVSSGPMVPPVEMTNFLNGLKSGLQQICHLDRSGVERSAVSLSSRADSGAGRFAVADYLRSPI